MSWVTRSRVTRRPRPRDLDVRDGVVMAAVEPLRQPQERRARLDLAPGIGRKGHSSRLAGLGHPLAMVMKRDLPDRLQLVPAEAVELRVDDQVVGMAVVLLVLDQVPDVVEERGRLQPAPGLDPKPQASPELIEEAQGEAGDLLAVGLRRPKRRIRRTTLLRRTSAIRADSSIPLACFAMKSWSRPSRSAQVHAWIRVAPRRRRHHVGQDRPGRDHVHALLVHAPHGEASVAVGAEEASPESRDRPRLGRPAREPACRGGHPS